MEIFVIIKNITAIFNREIIFIDNFLNHFLDENIFTTIFLVKLFFDYFFCNRIFF